MIGTLPKALHYTISFMGHDTSIRITLPAIDLLHADGFLVELGKFDKGNPGCLVLTACRSRAGFSSPQCKARVPAVSVFVFSK
jgi:hypothetical protein